MTKHLRAKIMLRLVLIASLLLNMTLFAWHHAISPWKRDSLIAEVSAQFHTSRPVILLGDSILDDLQASPGVFNLAVSGATTLFTQVEILPIAIALRPRRVIIGLGINDLRNGAAPATVADGIVTIVRSIAEADPRTEVIVLAVLPLAHMTQLADQTDNAEITELNDIIAEYAKQGGIGFVNHTGLLASAGTLDGRLTFDGLHPNNAGQAILSRLLFSGLANDAE